MNNYDQGYNYGISLFSDDDDNSGRLYGGGNFSQQSSLTGGGSASDPSYQAGYDYFSELFDQPDVTSAPVQQEDDRGFFGVASDLGKSFVSGIGSTVRGASWLTGKALGAPLDAAQSVLGIEEENRINPIDDAYSWLAEQGGRTSQVANEALTEEGRRAKEGGPFGSLEGFGHALSESMYSFATSMGVGGVANAATQRVASAALQASSRYRNIAAMAAQGAPRQIAQLNRIHKFRDMASGAIGFGGTESALAAGMAGAEMESMIMGMSHEDLYNDSVRYQAIYNSAEDLQGAEREDYARQLLAQEAGNEVAFTTATFTAIPNIVSGGVMGRLPNVSKAVDSIGAGPGVGNALKRAGVAGATEATQEFFQSGGEQFAQNMGIRKYLDPDKDLTDGVLKAALAGGAVGGVLGGGYGALAKANAESPNQKQSEENATPEQVTAIKRYMESFAEAGVDQTSARQLLRWRLTGDIALSDFEGAARELAETGQLPERVRTHTEGDFTDTGTLSEAAFVNDGWNDAGVEVARIRSDNPEQVADDLFSAGVIPYQLDNGDIVVPARNTDVLKTQMKKSGYDFDVIGPGRALTGVDEVAGRTRIDPTIEGDVARQIIDMEANKAATSDQSEYAYPTEAQTRAGNYPKGKLVLGGLPISIENSRGSIRKGKGWSRKLKHHYGDIKGTTGADGDNIDVFLGDEAHTEGPVFIVNQRNDRGAFDEHKVMLGFKSEAEARDAYLSEYPAGWKGLDSVATMDREAFKGWLRDGDHTRAVNPLGGGAMDLAGDRLRVKGLDPDEYAQSSEMERLAAAGVTSPRVRDQLMATRRKAEREPTFNYYQSTERVPTVRRAQKIVQETGQPATYIEADIRNLGGLNAAVGTSEADKILRRIGDDALAAIETSTNAAIVPIRRGGDEISFVMVGADAETSASVAAAIEAAAAKIAEDEGLSDLPHTKEGRSPGFGLIAEASEITADRSLDAIFKEADVRIERRKPKEGSENVQRSETETFGDRSQSVGGRNAPDGGRNVQADGGREGDAGAVEESPQLEFPRFSLAPPTDSAAFKRWFGDSKVVDANGEPLVVYHGTKTSFTEFKTGIKSKRGLLFTEIDVESQGMFFTESRYDAENYGKNVSAFYLSAQNPLKTPDTFSYKDEAGRQKAIDDINYIFQPVVDKEHGHVDLGTITTPGPEDPEWYYNFLEQDTVNWWVLDNPEVISRMKEKGYDGVKVEEPNDEAGYSWMVFYPEQIKSVNNRGTFDPTNPDIRFALQDRIDERVAARQPTQKVSPERLRKHIEKVQKNWAATAAEVVDTVSDLPQSVQDYYRDNGISANINAVYVPHMRKAFLVAENIGSIRQAEKELVEEVLSHQGLRWTMGSEMNPWLDQVWDSAQNTEGMQDVMRAYSYAKPDTVEGRRILAEEYVAKFELESPTLWDMFKAAVRRWLRARGLSLKLSDAEMRDMMDVVRSRAVSGLAMPRGDLPATQVHINPDGELVRARMMSDGTEMLETIHDDLDGDGDARVSIRFESGEVEYRLRGTPQGDQFKRVMKVTKAGNGTAQHVLDYAAMMGFDYVAMEGGPESINVLTAEGTEATAAFKVEAPRFSLERNGLRAYDVDPDMARAIGEVTTDGVEARITKVGDVVTLEKLVVPESQRNEGLGSAFMDALTQQADQRGLTLALTADGDFGGTKAGQRRFYRRFGFTKNTDPEISEGMVRLPVREQPRFSLAPPPNTEAFQSWFKDSKVVGENGQPKVVYHGAKRPDRIGSRFRKDRATSGPMAFFTDDPAIASSYATNKEDTSFDPPETYSEWFKYGGKRIDLAWYGLPRSVKDTIMDRFNRVTVQDMETGDDIPATLLPEGETAYAGKDHWDYVLKESRGNPIAAMVDVWLNSGGLFGQEEDFMGMLREVGLDPKFLEYDSPNVAYPAVMPAFLSIQNPLDTGSISDDVADALREAGEGVEATDDYGIDSWDKRAKSGDDWIADLEYDLEKGTTYAWTTIPDWVTETLQSLGYDGIQDTGGKGGGDSHTVWIPFEETQVKSSTGNRGTFSPDDPDIRFSLAPPTESKAFRDWFGDSKVVDANGEPEVATHYTQADFTVFDHDAQSSARLNESGYTRRFGTDYVFPKKGFFFFVGRTPGSNLEGEARKVQAYLSIQDPVDLTTHVPGAVVSRIIDAMQSRYNKKATPGNASYTVTGKLLGGFRNARKNGAAPDQVFQFIDTEGLGVRGETWNAVLSEAGFDGIIMDAGSSGTSVLEPMLHPDDKKDVYKVAIALRPEQIKSVNNQGTFDPTNPDIRFSLDDTINRVIKPTENLTGLRGKISEFMAGLKQFSRDDVTWHLRHQLFDTGAPIQRLETNVFGKVLDARDSAYKMYGLSKNITGVMESVFKHGIPVYRDGAFQIQDGRKGLVEIFEPLFTQKGLLAKWEAYAVARRAKRLMQEGRESRLTMDEINNLLELDAQFDGMFERIFQDWQTFNRNALDLAVDRGALDPDMAEKWATNDYVPFYRAEEDLENTRAGGGRMMSKRGLDGQSVTSRRLKGADARVEHVFENMVMNTAKILDKVYRNETMRRIVGIGEGVAMEKVPMAQRPVELSTREMARTLAKAGLVIGRPPEAVVRQGSKAVESWLESEGIAQVEAMSQEELDSWQTFFRPVAPQGPDIVSVMVNGKPEFYRVHDAALLKTIQALEPTMFKGLADKIFRGPKRILTELVTADPGFMMANFIRDFGSTFMSVDAYNEPISALSGALGSLKDIVNNDGLMAQVMTAGGAMAGFYDPTQNVAEVLKRQTGKGVTVLNSPLRLYQAWRSVGRATEQANRMAVAKATLAKGGSIAEAAWQAQDVMNFSQHGASDFVRMLIEVVPFLNARMQGLYKIFFRSATGETAIGDQQAAKRAFFMKGTALALLSMALYYLHYREEEEYERVPDHDKDMNWHFWFGEGEDKTHWVIPKPFELGLIFSTVPERMARFADGRDSGEEVTKAMSRNLMSTLAFNPTPQTARPLIESIMNHNTFTGNPIVNQSLAGLSPEAQYHPWTSETARAFANLNAALLPEWMRSRMPDFMKSPVHIEHIVRGYFGTVGSYTMQMSDAMVRAMMDEPPAPAGRVTELSQPFGNIADSIAGRVYRAESATEGRNRFQEMLYDKLEIANGAYRSLNKYQREGRLEAMDQVLNTRGNYLAYREYINSIATDLRELNTVERQIRYDRTMTPQQKRDELNRITQTRNAILEQAAPVISQL